MMSARRAVRRSYFENPAALAAFFTSLISRGPSLKNSRSHSQTSIDSSSRARRARVVYMYHIALGASGVARPLYALYLFFLYIIFNSSTKRRKRFCYKSLAALKIIFLPSTLQRASSTLQRGIFNTIPLETPLHTIRFSTSRLPDIVPSLHPFQQTVDLAGIPLPHVAA